jgi:ATP-dependent RNA helicase DHX29
MITPVASSPYDSDSSLDPDTLLPKFLELQTKLYDLRPELFDQPKKGKKSGREQANVTTEDPQVARLQRKLASIENDVLFDRDEGEYRWREKLDDLRREAAFSRRVARDEGNGAPVEPEVRKPDEASTEAESGAGFMDDNGDTADLLGDMFETDEPILETGIITEELKKASVTMRDFGKWTGLSPRRVLEETCKSRYEPVGAPFVVDLKTHGALGIPVVRLLIKTSHLHHIRIERPSKSGGRNLKTCLFP